MYVGSDEGWGHHQLPHNFSEAFAYMVLNGTTRQLDKTNVFLSTKANFRREAIMMISIYGSRLKFDEGLVMMTNHMTKQKKKKVVA